jgi:hypothetical protein
MSKCLGHLECENPSGRYLHTDLKILDILRWPDIMLVETLRGWTYTFGSMEVGQQLPNAGSCLFFPDFWSAVKDWETYVKDAKY